MSDTEVKTEETTATQESTRAPQTEGPDLTIQDLAALKSIIDVASSRGTFKPNEMMTVGQVYTKLETFLNAVAETQAKAQGGQ